MEPTAATTTQLQERIRELEDRQELTDLVSRLARWLDEHDVETAHSLFTADAAADTPGGRVHGIDGLVAQARRNHQAASTQHLMTNVLVGIDRDTASITANLLVTFTEPGTPGAPFFASGARYRLAARRDGDGWKLTRIVVAPVWSAGQRPVPTPA